MRFFQSSVCSYSGWVPVTFIATISNSSLCYAKLEVKPSHYRSCGFQEVGATRFQYNRHMKVVGLSAVRTGRLYPPGNIPGTHFCWRLSASGRIMSMKNSNDTIGNRTRDLPACVMRCLSQLRHRVHNGKGW